MLSTPFICCSIGVATACSRVCASAPTYVACNLISGGTMLGNCATGRLAMVTAPTITVRMAITIATMGRLMKKLDISSGSFQLISALSALPIWEHGEGLGRSSHATHLLVSVSRAVFTQLVTNGL